MEQTKFGYFYIRQHISYDLHNVYKIGITKNIPKRNNQYITGEFDRGKFIYVFEVKKVEMRNIENLLKEKFENLNMYIGGGTEFFDKNIIEYIEPFFKQNKFEYKKLDNEEIKNLTRTKDTKKELIYKPRYYQDEIIQISINYFKTKDKGILVLPCGLGKTLISLFIVKDLNINTILIGVPNTKILYQWKNIIKILFENTLYLEVYDDIKINIIEKFLVKNKKCIVITTYHSVYKVREATKNIEFIFDMKIFDEVHHLTSINTDIEYTKKFINILYIPSNKQLSLTATLKQIENNIENNKVISNNNIEYFGDIIDRKCLLWSIKNNIVCDYVIQTIITNDKQIDMYDIKDDIDKKLFLSAYASLKSIYDKNTKHLLVYSNKKENSMKIIKYIEKLLDDKYFDIDLYCSEYNSDIDTKEQENILDNFNRSKYSVLCCVYCLGEGYDNCIIDGVVFSSNMTSNIRILQSALRAGRKNKLDYNKIAKIILPILNKDEWLDNNECTDYINIREIIYQMGLEDETIEQKIKVYNIDIKKQKKRNDNKTEEFSDYNNELTKEIKEFALKTVRRDELNFTTYEKVVKIVVNKNIKDKEEYYRLCESDNRLPREPEKIYKNKFKSWIEFLNIERKYYSIERCIEKVEEYLEKYPEIKNDYMKITEVTKKLCEIDDMFPPYILWEEYYNKNINDIVIIRRKRK